MKATISIPDGDFEAAEQAAQELGLSRSELYATAVREYIARRQRQDVTERLNELYGDGEESSHMDPVLAKLQSMSLRGSEASRDLVGSPTGSYRL